MKALYFNQTGSVDYLTYGDINLTNSLLKGQVKIKFLAGSLNHLDLWVIKGLPRVKYLFPHIAGADLCGQVIESKSSQFKPGDRVVIYPAKSSGIQNGCITPENLCSDFKIRGENTPGVFCEEIIVEDKYCLPAPPHLSPEEAACLPLTYLTAWQMIEKSQVISFTQGKLIKPLNILIHGAGSGVTHALLNLISPLELTSIAVSSRSKNKLSNLRTNERGFYCDEKIEDSLKSEFPDKFDIIFDHVGERYFEMNIRLLKNGGKLITCGATSGSIGKLDLRHLYFRQLQLLGSTMGSLAHFRSAISWVNAHHLKPRISQVFSIEKGQEAFHALENQTQDGKIILLGDY